MEDGAIKAGFASLKDGREYDALFASALCRAKADWLIGINATRLFSCLYGKTLNVGRVQTPTLKMLTDRDAAISHFQKEKYYHVRLDLSGAEAASERISDKAEAAALKGACETQTAVCVSLTREKKTAAPPKLFDLTSLQREANRIFGYTAKQTLDLAQSLYEKRLLTYPRTDSSFLTDDMGGTAAGIIALLCEKLPFMAGADFTPEVAKVLDSKKVSDHHAIIPTMELAKAGPDALPKSEKNILTLAGARLLSAPFPARSIAERSDASLWGFGGVVVCSVTFAAGLGKPCPSESSGSVTSAFSPSSASGLSFSGSLCRHTPQHWTGKRICSGRKSPLSANAPVAVPPSMRGRKTIIAATKNVPLSCGRMTAFSRNARPIFPRRLPPRSLNPARRIRGGVPVPGSFHSREKRRFAVGLRRGRGMLRYLCGGVRKALSLGKLRQRHALVFPVLRVGLLFQCRPVSAFNLFPPVRKNSLSPRRKLRISA